MTDIIALAKKHGGKFHGPHVEHLSIPETAFVSMMEEYNALLEAEIRKEYEAELAETIRVSDATCDSYAEENQQFADNITALTEQNAKLMEALKQAEREQREAVREAASEAARQERFPDEPYGTY